MKFSSYASPGSISRNFWQGINLYALLRTYICVRAMAMH